MKRAFIPCLALLLAAASWGQETVKEFDAQANLKHVSESGLKAQKEITHTSSKSGSALLDLYMTGLSMMVQQGTGTPDTLDKRLQEVMLAAKKAREANEIDGVFFYRFNRLLAVTKLVAVPDPTGILVPVIMDFLASFVLDKLGHDEFRVNGKGPKAISLVGAALSAEIIDLQIYLETSKQRETLQYSLQEKMAGAPKK
jgi:hypothetical protein